MRFGPFILFIFVEKIFFKKRKEKKIEKISSTDFPIYGFNRIRRRRKTGN